VEKTIAKSPIEFFRPCFPKSVAASLILVACIAVLGCILFAGLWPFHAPKNQVSWSSDGDGLFFGKYGSIVSATPFSASQLGPAHSCSLEIWLQPMRIHSSGTILAFYQPERQVTTFSLRQSLGDLTLQSASNKYSGRARKIRIYVDDVLRHAGPILITIRSDKSGTEVFADGLIIRRFENFEVSVQDLTGQLIVGNSPVTTDDWSGKVRGLAIYDYELSADEVLQHFANWMHNDRSDHLIGASPVALYLFREGTGNKVHNLANSATDLLIPERFFVLHGQFLERPWDEFRPNWNYWKDLGINIAGFIPFGFFYAYLFQVHGFKRVALMTIAFGFVVSLTIEVLQAFLPTRDSGMTDLITNTLGTALGTIAFTLGKVHGYGCGSGTSRSKCWAAKS
jgi:hypothetical protein